MRSRTINGRTVTLARESRGWTQSELAQKLYVTQAAISQIENNTMPLGEDMLTKMSELFGYDRSFFYEPDTVGPLSSGFFRKAPGLSGKRLSQILGSIQLDCLSLQKMLKSVEFPSDSEPERLPYLPIDGYSYTSASSVAKALRSYWRIGPGPIDSLTPFIEWAGIIVVLRDYGPGAFDGISHQFIPGRWVIFLNSASPPDRRRLTLAHELGHAIMHRIPSEKMEDEAFEFAAEFLMPFDDIASDLSDISFDRLAQLKRKWKVSMQSIIVRASELGVLSKSDSTYFWKRLSKLGYRKIEPLLFGDEKERPVLLHDIVLLHVHDLGYTDEDMMKIFYIREEDYPIFNPEYRPKPKLIYRIR